MTKGQKKKKKPMHHGYNRKTLYARRSPSPKKGRLTIAKRLSCFLVKIGEQVTYNYKNGKRIARVVPILRTYHHGNNS